MMTKTKKLLVLLGMVVVYAMFIISGFMSQWRRIVHDQGTFLIAGDTYNRGEINETHQQDSNRTYKRILYWTPYFNSDDFRFGFGHEAFVERGCAVSDCEATADRGLIGEVDVVLIHTPLVDEMPPRPLPHQTYVMIQDEPHMANSHVLMPAMADYFNLTMTYRHDSDITIQYAHEIRNVAFSELVDVDPKTRPKSVVWVVSHCETPSRRELYVAELAKHIDVDIYGECGTLTCPKKNNTYCREMYEQNYRFYLSFENDVCQDYVSEKLYHPLKYKIIPIVYGGADYDTRTPRNSVININDYPNPKDLADYLHSLTENRTAYNEYFKWKRSGIWYDLNPYLRMANGICRLCEILHDKQYIYRDYRDLKTWWVDGSCNTSAMDSMTSTWSNNII